MTCCFKMFSLDFMNPKLIIAGDKKVEMVAFAF